MLLIKIRKSRRTRFIAMFMAINILAEIISPSLAMALTTGPSQPEVQSFEPVSTSEMVDLFSGDFKYNIPLMDVGGYPLNINYNSGVSMDQEATWTGLGWNLNVGAITRNMRGLPDDFNGMDAVKKEFNMKDNESYGGHLKLGFEIFGWGKLPQSASTNISIGLAINYNNYSGVGVTQSAGVSMGLAAGKSSSGKMNMGLGISSSASEGLDLNPSVSFSAKVNDNDGADAKSSSLSIGVGMSINSRSGLKQLSLNATASYSNKKNGTKGGKSGSYDAGGDISSSGAVNFGVSTYVPIIQFPMTTNAVATNFKLGGHIFGMDVSANIGGYYSNQHLSTRELNLPAYGYLYSEVGQNNDNGLMDFNREKDGAYNRNMQKLPVTNFTYDVYSVAGQGVGGTYRPFRHDVGYVFDNESRTTSDSYTLGGEVDCAQLVHAGIDVSVVDVNTVVGKWSEQNKAKDKLFFNGSIPNTDDEKFAFKEVGEKSVDEDPLFDYIGKYAPARVALSGSGMNVSANDKLEYFYPSGGPLGTSGIVSNKRAVRHKRNQVISTLTYDEAKTFGLEPALYTSINGAKPHHIAEITVTKTDGSRYVYGLPAYNTEQIEATFNVTGNSTNVAKGMVEVTGSDDSNGNTKGNDHYFNRVTTPAYAHAHMLTAVVSSDYVDSDGIPGPTDGDLGNYTKFNYSPVSNFEWRTPVTPYTAPNPQANFNENTKKASIGDDYGSYVSGKKDLQYVTQIVTKNYIAIFEMANREDAMEVSQNNGKMLTDRSRLLKNIKLYSKPEYNKQQASGGTFVATPIKVVNFVYNYELCPGVLNNSGNALSGTHYINSTNATGKLTLKQIYFTYGSSEKAKLNTYDFTYSSSNNPAYDQKAYDRWGNYKVNPVGASTDAIGGSLSNSEFPYVAQASQSTADNNSSAWSLSKITLPSGADINIEYESDDYAFVQNLPAMNMCKVTNIASGISGPVTTSNQVASLHQPGGAGAGSPNNYIIFELPRAVPTSAVGGDASGYFRKHMLKDMCNGRYMYFRFLVNMTKQGNSVSQNLGDYFEYVSGYAQISSTSFGFMTPTGSDYTHGYVLLNNVNISKNNSTAVNPIAKAAWQMGRINYPNLVWDASFNPNGGPADVIKALIQSDFTQNIIDAIKGPNLAIASKQYGTEAVLNKSWVRLYNAEGKKYGGGCRVKKLTINDNWDKMTVASPSTESQKDFTYGQTYEYTTEESGRTISSGVAAYEPMIGGDEIPQRLPNYYTNQGNNPEIANLLIPSDQFFTEEPYGESFYPAASIGYSKIKVANLKRTDPANPNTKIVKAHATGHVVHKFYTAKDYPTITRRTSIDKKTFKPPFAGLLKIFARDFMTVTQGHAIEVNDMHGKPRGMEVYAEDKPNQPISSVEYKYKTDGPNGYEEPSCGDMSTDAKFKANKLNNDCNIIRSNGNITNAARIGVDYDMVADFRESKTTTVMGGAQINLSAFLVAAFPAAIPTIWPDFSRDVTRFRSAVTTKVIYRYGILEKTIATDLGSKVETSNLAYDSETGEVLLTKTQNNFEDPIYSFNFPAHWSYDRMGQAYKNIGTSIHGTLSNPSAVFCIGDEVSVNGTTKGWVCNVTSSSLSVIDVLGNPIPINSLTDLKILRSGRRNQQSTPVGSIISLVNPIDVNNDGTLNSTLSFGGSPDESKVIKTGAVEFADHWQMYPGWTEQSPGSCSCTATQAAIDWKKLFNALIVTNKLIPGNAVMANLPCPSTPLVTYYPQWTSLLQTGWYSGDCKPEWVTQYSTPTSTTTGLAANVLYGGIANAGFDNLYSNIEGCQMSLTLPVGYSWSTLKLDAKDSLSIGNINDCSLSSHQINMNLYVNGTIIPVVFYSKCFTLTSCSTSPPTIVYCSPNIGDKVNPFVTGIKGNWRMLKSWSYLSEREQTLSGSASTKNTNIRKDGTLLTKDPTGTPVEFKSFWTYNGSRYEESNPTYWTYTSEVTKYSPYGPELENRDALGRYSSAVYGYNESLPLAVGANSKLQEIAYDGFEDYDFINPLDCKKRHFNFYENKTKRKNTQSHTGNYSMEVINGTSVVAKRKLPAACTYSVNPLCTYSLTCTDLLPLFSPTPQKYVVSYWVKEVKTGSSPASPTLNYGYSTISISTTVGGLVLSAPVKTGIIDGWQRVERTFDIPSGASGEILWDPLESTCRHASLSIL